MEEFVKYWGGMGEDESKTPHSRWMPKVKKQIEEKVKNTRNLTITEGVGKIIKKNWSALGVDGISNFW